MEKGQISLEGIISFAIAATVGLFLFLALWNATYSEVTDYITNSGSNSALTQGIFDLMPLFAVIMVGVSGFLLLRGWTSQQRPPQAY